VKGVVAGGHGETAAALSRVYGTFGLLSQSRWF